MGSLLNCGGVCASMTLRSSFSDNSFCQFVKRIFLFPLNSSLLSGMLVFIKRAEVRYQTTCMCFVGCGSSSRPRIITQHYVSSSRYLLLPARSCLLCSYLFLLSGSCYCPSYAELLQHELPLWGFAFFQLVVCGFPSMLQPFKHAFWTTNMESFAATGVLWNHGTS